MKINPYIQVQQVYGTQKAGGVKKTGSVSRTDNLTISSIGRDIQVAKQAVAASADVRADVVEPLKKQVEAGTYQVSEESFADKLWRIAGER